MEYKEFDFEGEETLKAMSHANRLNHWMFSQIKPFAKGKVLEIGSGLGNISQHFIAEGYEIDLSDIRTQYTDFLKVNYPNNDTLNIDIVDPNFDSLYGHLFGAYDLVYALNVVEHIKNDSLALQNMNKLLKSKGFIYILVPAYSFLYNNFDRALFHYRRYTKKTLTSIFPEKLKIISKWHFNLAGIFGWYIVGNLLKKEIIPESNMKLYNILTPIFKIIDFITFRKVGLSVIVVAQKI